MIARQGYLKQIEPFIGKNIVKVLVGVRRSGKSTLLEMIRERLLIDGVSPENILLLNFESAELFDVSSASDLTSWVCERVSPGGRVHLLLDEIQEVDGWEKAIRSFMVDFDADIYITGSNAHLLSSDLATHITGRYVSIDVYPFSFAEFFEAMKLTQSNMAADEAFSRYLVQGGFPFQVELDFDQAPSLQYLGDVYSTILLRDVVDYAGIRDVDQLQRIIRYAIAEQGHLLTPKRIADYLKSERRKSSQETVANYLEATQAAFLLYRASREDLVGKRRMQFNEKFYVVDQGLRQAIGLDNLTAIDQVLEGIVFMELKRRGYEVTVGKVGEKEIDFVARKDSEVEYYQVTYLLASDEVRKREFGSLEQINDNFPKYVLSMDQVQAGRSGIKSLNIVDWLLQEADQG